MLPFGRTTAPDPDAAGHRNSGSTFTSPASLALLILVAGLCVIYLLYAAARRLYSHFFGTSATGASSAPPPPPASSRRCRRDGTMAMDPAEVAVSLPVRAYAGGAADDVCAVCLGELRAEEPVKVIPACGHVFHPPCIDRWLLTATGRASCPLCRRSAVDAGTLNPAQAV